MDWLRKWAQTTQTLALKCLDTQKSFSYPELDFATSQLAYFLIKEIDIKPGDRICFLAANCWEHILCYFACVRIGAIFVPLNFRLSTPEVLAVINDSQPKLCFFSDTFSDVFKKSSFASLNVESIASKSSKKFDRLLSSEMYSEIDRLNLQRNPSLMLYTSGTTGKAKGVLLGEEGMFWNAINTSMRLGINFETHHLCFHPFFHASGWNVLTLPTLRFGGTVFLTSKFDPSQVLRHLDEQKISILFAVPTMLDRLARAPEFSNTNLASVHFAIVGGEPMPQHAIALWHRRNIPIRQGFGLTEFGPNVFSLNAEDAESKLGSIGTPNFYLEVRVIGNNGRACGPDEIGELQLKGPVCMLEYWNNSCESEKAFTDGWFKTGDLVSFDADGYFFVRGRKKEMYISGGENVFPAEVENALRSIPQVHEAAVIGVPDAKWGEVGCAFVVLTANSFILESDLISEVAQSLAKYKIPKHVKFTDIIPKSDSGKVLKSALLERYLN